MSVAVHLCCLRAGLGTRAVRPGEGWKRGADEVGWNWEQRHPNGALGQTLSLPTGHKAKAFGVRCWSQVGADGRLGLAERRSWHPKGCSRAPARGLGVTASPERCCGAPAFPTCLGGTALASPPSRRQEGSSEGRHQPEVYLNVWLSAPPRPNPGKEPEWGQPRRGMGNTPRDAPRQET